MILCECILTHRAKYSNISLSLSHQQ